MKSTKILLNTESGRKLGESNALGCIGLVGYIILFMIIVFSENSVKYISEDILGFSELKEGKLVAFYAVLCIIGLVGAVITDLLHWLKVIIRTVHFMFIEPFQDVRTKSLFLKKINYDIRNSQLNSSENIKSEIAGAIDDAQKMKSIINDTGNGWINNKDFWEIELNNFSNPVNDKIIKDFPVLDKDLKSQYTKEINNIIQVAKGLPEKLSIEYYVAAVQPAFYIHLKKVINDCKLNQICKIIPNTLTGPQTVLKCMELKHKNLKPNTILSFIAPLSAFVTAEYKNGQPSCIDPRIYFSPLINLAAERQTIFYVEGNTSLPVPKRNLYFLNNSTAEECIALLNEELEKRFEPCVIEDFSDYIKLLNGVPLNDGTQLSKGDGIVLWSPLSDHFDEKDVNNKFLKGKDQESNFEFANYSKSKIMLFGEKELNNYNEIQVELYKSLTYAFILRVALANSHLVKGKATKLRRRIGDWWYATRVFNEGHESIFKKLFKQ